MADFDPQDVVNTSPAGTPPPAPSTSDFDPKDVVQLQPGQDFDQNDVQGQVTQSEPPKMLRRQDIQNIARKHGADPQELESLAPYYGVALAPEDATGSPDFASAITHGVKSAIGFADVTGLARFAAKKATSPETRAALDEISEIGEKQKSIPQTLSEFAVPLPTIGRAATGMGRIAEATGIGGAIGLGHSKEGEELKSSVTGAGFGAGLGVVGEGLVAGLGKLGSKLTDTEKQAIHSIPSTEKARIDADAHKIMEGTKEADGILNEAVLAPGTKLSPEQIDKIVEPHSNLLDPMTEEGALLREQVHAKSPELLEATGSSEAATKQYLAEQILEERGKDLAEHLSGSRPKSLEEAQKVIQEVGSRQGAEYIQEMQQLLRKEEAALQVIREQHLERVGRPETFLEKYIINPASDAQFPIRTLDERLGTSAGLAQSDLVRNNNRMTWARKAQDSDIRKLATQFKDVDSSLRSGRITDAIDSGDLSSLSPREQDAAKHVQATLENWRLFVNGAVKDSTGIDRTIAPLNIPQRENYIPHLMLSNEKMIPKVQVRMQEALQEASSNLGRDITSLNEISKKELQDLIKADGALKDLAEAVTFSDATKLRDGRNLQDRLQDTFFSRNGGAKMHTLAKAAEAREGEMPDWLREKNTYQLLDKWSNNTLRHVYLRQPLARLASASRVADAAGDKLGAGYLNRLMQDMNGLRPMTAAANLRDSNFKWQRTMGGIVNSERAPDSLKKMAMVGQVLPEIMQDFAMQIYPNLIGLNAKSHVQHLIQPFYKMWPELGYGKYGTSVLVRSLVKTVVDFRSLAARTLEAGLEPAAHTGVFNRATAEGVRSSPAYSAVMNASRLTGQASMYLYGKIFMMNKMIAKSVGETMAADLARGSKYVDSTLSKLPSSVQREVRASPMDVQKNTQLLGQYFGDTAVYNYSRAAKSEFGRTMGNLMSTFTKWPLATAGDILTEYRTKSAGKASAAVLRKYMAPLIALEAMQYYLFGADNEMSDRAKKILGHGGLGNMAPIKSLVELKHREFGTPPVIDTLVKHVLVPVLHGDPEALGHGVANTLQQFTPGSVYVRFLTDDLPTYIQGRRPEGDDFIERTQEGMRQITK